MRLAFFCGSLEFGRDGVGDYCRRLAVECIRQGHECVLVALNDPCIKENAPGKQELDEKSISVLRLSGIVPWDVRVKEARKWLEDFKPDWISLQFVPFGFHRKGLCFGLGKIMVSINPGAAWHLMFHELWLGLGEDSRLKDRVVGTLQKSIIKDFIRRLQPRIFHTQAEPYQEALRREKIKASILPLFSNIPNIRENGWSGLLEPLVAEAAGKQMDRGSVYLAGILGGVHPEWNAEEAVNTLIPLVQKNQRQLVLVFHGKNNLSTNAFKEMKLKLTDRALVVVTGERSTADISRIVQTLDLGIATSPMQIIQKSGSAAAMLEHGLQLLVTRDDWRLRGNYTRSGEHSSRLLTPKQFASLTALPAKGLQPPEEISVHRVAERLLAAMQFPVSAEAATLS